MIFFYQPLSQREPNGFTGRLVEYKMLPLEPQHLAPIHTSSSSTPEIKDGPLKQAFAIFMNESSLGLNRHNLLF